MVMQGKTLLRKLSLDQETLMSHNSRSRPVKDYFAASCHAARQTGQSVRDSSLPAICSRSGCCQSTGHADCHAVRTLHLC